MSDLNLRIKYFLIKKFNLPKLMSDGELDRFISKKLSEECDNKNSKEFKVENLKKRFEEIYRSIEKDDNFNKPSLDTLENIYNLYDRISFIREPFSCFTEDGGIFLEWDFKNYDRDKDIRIVIRASGDNISFHLFEGEYCKSSIERVFSEEVIESIENIFKEYFINKFCLIKFMPNKNDSFAIGVCILGNHRFHIKFSEGKIKRICKFYGMDYDLFMTLVKGFSSGRMEEGGLSSLHATENGIIRFDAPVSILVERIDDVKVIYLSNINI